MLNAYPWSHAREDWENPNQTIDQHTQSGPFPWDTADLIAVHYTAAVDVPDGDPDELPWDRHVAAYLRAIQNDYVTNRGYSIGYGVLVTQNGDDWEVRGVRNQNAANLNYNSRTFTILVFVDGADPLTEAALVKVRSLVDWFRRESPRTDVTIVGHRDIGATACPGAGVYDQITAGLLEPGDDMTPLDIPERIFDSRDTYEFRADETRTIPVGSRQAFLHVTLLSSAPGYVSVSGSDIRSYASLVNADVQGGVSTGGAPISLPDGSVRVFSKSGGHIIIDVYARG